MEKKEFIKISGKLADGLADEEEIRRFNTYFNQYQEDFPEWDELHSDLKNNILTEVKGRIKEQVQPEKTVRKIPLWNYIAYAASIVMVVGIGFLYFNKKDTVPADQQLVNDIAPGKEAATLTLSDGSEIVLAGQQPAEFTNEPGVLIHKDAQGQIAYHIQSPAQNGKGKMNTLRTARGETYSLRLTDGSVVWLNSESSVTYPVALNESASRAVELKGEAYFEVAADAKRPFIVQSNRQKLQVLGTSFNVNSYPDEPNVKTTLLEGAVKINEKTVLKPNQQSIVSVGGIKVIPVNAETFIDWKDGIFSFQDESLPVAMRKIARWYNVELIFDDRFDHTKTFSGTIAMNKNISQVLKVLEESVEIHFSLDGRRLTVKK